MAAPDVCRPLNGDSGLTTFEEALQQQLSLLRKALGFQTWALARVVGDNWIVMETLGAQAPLRRGARFPWAETLCHRAFHRRMPALCPDLDDLPRLDQAPLRIALNARAYLGVGLADRKGQFIGTVCAFDPVARFPPASLPLGWLQEVARHLATLVDREFEIARESRRAAYDSLRGLPAEEVWAQLLDHEESWRKLLFGPVSIIAMSVTGLTAAACKSLKRSLGDDGFLTHFGGPEVLILMPERNAAQAHEQLVRLQHALDARGMCGKGSIVESLYPESLTDATQRARAALQAQ